MIEKVEDNIAAELDRELYEEAAYGRYNDKFNTKTIDLWNFCRRCTKQIPKPEIYCADCKHFPRLPIG